MFDSNFGKCEPIFKNCSPIHKKILYVHITKISVSLQRVATLPCESRKSKNVTDFDSNFNKLLTCSRGHYEDLI